MSNSILQAGQAANIDLDLRLSPRGIGATPLVPRQWPWVIFDSALVPLAKVICDRAERLEELQEENSKRFGKKAPKTLAELCAARNEVIEVIEEIGWFKEPSDNRLGPEVDRTVTSLNQLLDALEQMGHDPNSDLSIPIEATRKTTAALENAIAEPVDIEPAPISLVYDLFQIPHGDHFSSSALEPNTLRALSPLSDQELESLSGHLLAHLVVPGSAWMPSPTVHLAAMLVTERPLIAHRMAAFTSGLVSDIFNRHPRRAVKALSEQRKRGQSQFASSKEIAAEISLIREADERGDEEAVGLATARLYAAGVEGPVRGAATTLLQLHGVVLPEQPSLAFLRDQLRERTGPRVNYSLAIEPEWRNAVDHREFHWDPVQQTLDLRGQSVSREDLSSLYDFGISGMVGIECGITLAVAAHPKLLEDVNRASPLHEDRVLVEHRLAQNLARHGIAAKVATTAEGLTIGPIPDAKVIAAIGALISSIDSIKGIDRYEIRFEHMPPLIITREVLRRADRLRRRDEHNNRVLDVEALNPILVSGLIELGVAPEEALIRGAKAAATGVAMEAGQAGSISRKSRARRTAKQAERAIRSIREVARIASTNSELVQQLEKNLRQVERSATSYVRSGASDPDPLLAELRAFLDLLEELPTPDFPWVNKSGTEDPGA